MPENPTPEPPSCAVPGCDRPVVILAPLPMCEADALTVWREVLEREIRGEQAGE